MGAAGAGLSCVWAGRFRNLSAVGWSPYSHGGWLTDLTAVPCQPAWEPPLPVGLGLEHAGPCVKASPRNCGRRVGLLPVTEHARQPRVGQAQHCPVVQLKPSSLSRSGTTVHACCNGCDANSDGFALLDSRRMEAVVLAPPNVCCNLSSALEMKALAVPVRLALPDPGPTASAAAGHAFCSRGDRCLGCCSLAPESMLHSDPRRALAPLPQHPPRPSPPAPPRGSPASQEHTTVAPGVLRHPRCRNLPGKTDSGQESQHEALVVSLEPFCFRT